MTEFVLFRSSGFPWKTYQSKTPYLKTGCFTLVSHVDITWNSFPPYLINLDDKLEGLGFRYIDNDVVVNKEEE